MEILRFFFTAEAQRSRRGAQRGNAKEERENIYFVSLSQKPLRVSARPLRLCGEN
jgi:hypothetical protein